MRIQINDVVRVNFHGELIIGRVEEIIGNFDYLSIKEVVHMFPISNNQKGQVTFGFQKSEETIHFVGGGYFAVILEEGSELYGKYIQTISNIILMPGDKKIH